jgi:trans-2-enoyl-CoA reductase
MSKSLRCIALIVALMLVYGTATAKGYRWSCTYSEKASPAGIETDANLKLDFAFDDVTRKAIVLGNKGHSEVDVHIGSLAISFMEKLETGAVQTTVISFADDSTHSRTLCLATRTWSRANITDSVQSNSASVAVGIGIRPQRDQSPWSLTKQRLSRCDC